MNDVTALINGKTHVVITMTLGTNSALKKMLDKAERLGGIFHENRVEHTGGIFGQSVHVVKILMPEDKVYEFQKD